MGTEPPSTPQGAGPDWGEMKSKLTAARGADRMILVAGLVFLVDSFLPWYGVGFRGLGVRVSYTISGWNSGGLAILAIIFAILATAFAAVRVTGVKMELGTVKDGTLYLVLGGGALVFAILRLITEVHYTKYGLYVAIIAGAFLAAGGYQKYKATS